jgi:hypothetical protein
MLELVRNEYNPMTSNTTGKGKYTKSEKFYAVQPLKVKQFNLSSTNQVYYNSFESKFEGKPGSWAQYKVTVGDYLEKCDDFALVTVADIENYVNSHDEKIKHNKEAHLRSLMQWIVKNDVNGAMAKVSKEMLIYLI